MQTKKQRQEKALKRLREEYEKIEDERGYYIGNEYYVHSMNAGKSRIQEEIRTLERKLGIA